MKTVRLVNGLPPGIRGPHIDREGPCNDPKCHKCDETRDALFVWGMRQMKKLARRELVRAGRRQR